MSAVSKSTQSNVSPGSVHSSERFKEETGGVRIAMKMTTLCVVCVLCTVPALVANSRQNSGKRDDCGL